MPTLVQNATALLTPAVHEFSASSGAPPPIRVQIGGFLLIAALLGLDAYVGLHGASAIRRQLGQMDQRQAVSTTAVNRLLFAQQQLSSLRNTIPELSNERLRARSLSELSAIEGTLRQLFAELPPADDPSLWQRTEGAAFALTAELGEILESSSEATDRGSRLQKKYDDLSAATGRLVESSRAWSESSRIRLEQSIERQSLEDRLLLSGCLIVACLFLWTATRTRRLLAAQSEELSRVSWQLLERQENLARRLSRELHDELGQSLTALKTNLSRHAASACVDPSWMEDCAELLRDSIRNAHEVSQLLRPTVLDDFGLDSALSWLCERFQDRHNIETSYLADFDGRLDDQTETHVFRIAQEALTNVARHSRATRVRIHFWRDDGFISLEIADNGIGLPTGQEALNSSFGLTGMKARARSMHGAMQIVTSSGQGTAVRVTFPLRDKTDEKDQSSSG